ncbi:MAG: ABC transporter ATP-binding protein [Deltaproteobacteria bacterium]|nr:ABC transporter ATP-binding protein [Deltaproteobacteria bacterium]
MMLEVNKIFAGYQKVKVLHDVTVRVASSEIVCLLGANGAGKSTLLKSISGVISPEKGQIMFGGERIEGKAPNHIVRLGLSQVPEGRQIFPSLSVKQNLLLGTYANRLKTEAQKRRIEEAFGLFPVLKKKFNGKAGSMSGGEQQMLAIGRSLMSSPKMILFDEPSLGLAPLVVRDIFRTIRQLREENMSLMVVEQNAKSTLRIADRAYILETGKVVKEGLAKDFLEDEEVRRRYLGR